MLAEITDAGRAVVEAATADLVGARFAPGRRARRATCGSCPTLLRPVREAAGDF